MSLPIPLDKSSSAPSDELQPQRWLWLDSDSNATSKLLAALRGSPSALVQFRLSYGLVAVVAPQSLASAAVAALGSGHHALRVHGVIDPGVVQTALRSVLDPRQANRTQYVNAAHSGFEELLAELQEPDAAVLVGWWQSQGASIPSLGWPCPEAGFAKAAAQAFHAWVDLTGARLDLNAQIEANSVEAELSNTSAATQQALLQPFDAANDADVGGLFDSRARLSGRSEDQLADHRLATEAAFPHLALAASSRAWTLVMSRQLQVGKGPISAATSDLIEIFEPADAGPWPEALDIKVCVRLHADRWQGRTGLRLEIHLPRKLAIVVPLDSNKLRPERICSLQRDRLPGDPDGWQYAQFQLRAAARPVLR